MKGKEVRHVLFRSVVTQLSRNCIMSGIPVISDFITIFFFKKSFSFVKSVVNIFFLFVASNFAECFKCISSENVCLDINLMLKMLFFALLLKYLRLNICFGCLLVCSYTYITFDGNKMNCVYMV